MEANRTVSDALYRRHTDLCMTWRATLLKRLQISTELRISSSRKEDSQLRLAEKTCAGWIETRPPVGGEEIGMAVHPQELPEHEPLPTPPQSLMRDHQEWPRFQEYLQDLWKDRQQKALLPRESTGSQVIAHLALQPYNEAMLMAADRLDMTFAELTKGWENNVESHKRKTIGNGRGKLCKKGVLRLRQQTAPKNI